MELQSILEALLFSSQKPLTAGELRKVLVQAADETEDEGVRAFRKVKVAEVTESLEALRGEMENMGRSFRLACVAGAWQIVTRPDFAPWLRVLLGEKTRPPRLSLPALETLAIIAYRQPMTRAEIEQIRGVSVDGVMQTLLERGLLQALGRAEVVGRPMTYGTTELFLEYFGLRCIEDLPDADELRRIPVERPAALATTDPGLATAPEEGGSGEPDPDSAGGEASAGSGSEVSTSGVSGAGATGGGVDSVGGEGVAEGDGRK